MASRECQAGRRWVLLAFAAALLMLLTWVPGALAISAPIHIHGTGRDGVLLRPTPDTSHPGVGWMAEGTSPDYHCFTYGQMVGSVNVWFNVTHSGITGYYASYWDDSSYHSEAELTAKYGIPKCGAAAPPLPPSPSPPPPAPGPPANGSPPPTNGVDAPHASGGDTYVALGDSYSSGTGVPPYLSGTATGKDGCNRSALAWPFRVALDLGFYGRFFSFHACSGALVQSLTESNKNNHEPPQEHWLGSSTKLVTVTWGGDNADFPKVMTTCVLQLHCQLFWQFAVNRAIDKMGRTGPADPISLSRLYERIAHNAPNARIIVMGYPRFFPSKVPLACQIGSGLRLDHNTMVWINNEIKSMENTISGAVATARRHIPNGINYVQGSYDAFAGHELCTADPYYNTLSLKHRETSFHPNISGNRRMAELVEPIYKH